MGSVFLQRKEVTIKRIWQICGFHKNSETFPWRHNGHDSVSIHLPHDCLLSRLFSHRSKNTSKFRVTSLWHQSSGSLVFVTGEFPAQMASNAENASIWWRHHVKPCFHTMVTMHTDLWCHNCNSVDYSDVIVFNTCRPRQNKSYYVDDIFKFKSCITNGYIFCSNCTQFCF